MCNISHCVFAGKYCCNDTQPQLIIFGHGGDRFPEFFEEDLTTFIQSQNSKNKTVKSVVTKYRDIVSVMKSVRGLIFHGCRQLQ